MMTKYMEYRTIKDNLTIAFGELIEKKLIQVIYCQDNFTKHGWGNKMTYGLWETGKPEVENNNKKMCPFKIVKHDTIPEKIKSLMFIQEL